jgi:hypothetical protein
MEKIKLLTIVNLSDLENRRIILKDKGETNLTTKYYTIRNEKNTHYRKRF